MASKKSFEEWLAKEHNVKPDSKKKIKKKQNLQKRIDKVEGREKRKREKFVLRKKSKAHMNLHDVKTMDKVRTQNLKDLETLSEIKSGTYYRGDTSKKISVARQRQQASADIEKSGEYREKFEKKRGSKRRSKKALRLFKKKQRL